MPKRPMTKREERWYMVGRFVSIVVAYVIGVLIGNHYSIEGSSFLRQLLVIILCALVGGGMGYTLSRLNRRFWDHRLNEPLTRKRNDHDNPTHDG